MSPSNESLGAGSQLIDKRRIFYTHKPGLNVPTIEILKKCGFTPITEGNCPELKPNDLVFLTYCFPFDQWQEEILNKCLRVGAKSVLILLDLHSFYSSLYGRQFGYLTLDEEVKQRLYPAHYIIAQTEKMRVFLKEQNIGVPIYVYELFDFLIDENLAEKFHIDRLNYFEKEEKNRIVYAGIIGNHFRNFLYDDFYHRFKLDIYDGYKWPETSYNFPANRFYKGNYSNEELPFQFQGNYGLIWNNPRLTDAMRFKELSISSKLGLYVASELPIIVQEGTADADFVKKNLIGFTISDLEEIDSKLDTVTNETYKVWLANLKEFAPKVREGYYLKSCINAILTNFEAMLGVSDDADTL